MLTTTRTAIFLFAIVLAIIGWTDGLVPWLAEDRGGGWIGHHRSMVRTAEKEAENVRIAFLGDSITDQWRGNGRETWNRYYYHLWPANYGVSGDRTENGKSH